MSRTITVLTVIALAWCAYAGAMKLAHPELFAHWTVSNRLLAFAGVVEIASALLLVVPAARFFGSVGLMGLMVLALIAHLSAGRLSLLPGAIALLAMIATIAWHSRPRKLGLKPHQMFGARGSQRAV